MTGDHHKCRAYSRAGDRCSLKPGHAGSHEHHARTWWTAFDRDYGRPPARVDGVLAS